MTLDYEPAPVPLSTDATMSRYLQDELRRIGRAMSTDEYNISPGYIVKNTDGVTIGYLAETEQSDGTKTLTLVGAETDGSGNIIGLRPVGVIGTEWRMGCLQWTVPGLQLTPNPTGHDLRVAPDGVTVLAIARPPPGDTITGTGATDHDMSAVAGTWVKVTGESGAPVGEIPPGSTVTYGVYIQSRAAQDGGRVDIAGGINGVAPTAADDSFTIGAATELAKVGYLPLTSTIMPGDTISLWVRVANDGPQADLWVMGSIQQSFITASS